MNDDRNFYVEQKIIICQAKQNCKLMLVCCLQKPVSRDLKKQQQAGIITAASRAVLAGSVLPARKNMLPAAFLAELGGLTAGIACSAQDRRDCQLSGYKLLIKKAYWIVTELQL